MKGSVFIMSKATVVNKLITKEIESAVDKLNAIGAEIGQFVLEREEVIDIIKLALVAKRNVFFLGKTGQSKTFTVSEFLRRVTGANYFETLMNKMMDKDELFGRLDIPQLVQGKQKVITTGKIPEADFNFLDEIFKSNDIVLNSLLKVLNFEEINLEGISVKCPTIATFSASNEIPNFKKDEDKVLYPLYNRLHLKVTTDYIKGRDNFKKAVQAKRMRANENIKTLISLDEIKLLNDAVWSVVVPDEIDELVWELCEEIKRKTGLEVSDRKKIEYSVLVQANALLNKRNTVTLEDLKVLKYYLWELPEEMEAVIDIVSRFTENPIKDKLNQIKALATELIDEAIKVADLDDIKSKNKAFSKAEKELFQLHTAIKEVEVKAETEKDKELVENILSDFESLYKELNEKFKYTYLPIWQMKERQGL